MKGEHQRVCFMTFRPFLLPESHIGLLSTLGTPVPAGLESQVAPEVSSALSSETRGKKPV